MYLLQKDFNCQEDAVLKLQRYIRGNLTRNLILGNLVASFHCLIFYLIVDLIVVSNLFSILVSCVTVM